MTLTTETHSGSFDRLQFTPSAGVVHRTVSVTITDNVPKTHGKKYILMVGLGTQKQIFHRVFYLAKAHVNVRI